MFGRDEEELNFHYYFFKGLIKLYNTDNVNKIPKNLPIYTMYGDNDPLGKYGIGVAKLYCDISTWLNKQQVEFFVESYVEIYKMLE